MHHHFPSLKNQCSAHPVPTRRHFLMGAASLTAAVAAPRGWAQQSVSRIHDIRGAVRVNGELITERYEIKAGDVIMTGSDGRVVFVVGNDAFFLRERSELRLEKSTTGIFSLEALRMITGAVGMVFGKRNGPRVRISTPTVTAGIRGTGCYMETRGDATYFCTCYGAIDLTGKSADQNELVLASRHRPKLVYSEPRDGQWIVDAKVDNTHTDGDMDMLEKCVGRRAPWFTGQPNPYKDN